MYAERPIASRWGRIYVVAVLTDEGVRPRAGFVAALCVLASVTLTNSMLFAFTYYDAVMGGFYSAAVGGAPLFGGLGSATPNQLPVMTAGGAAAAFAAVLLLRRFGAVAWPWLVLGGAVLGLTAAVPYAVPPDQLDMIRSPAFVMAFGAAPVLVVVGLYGAASWLNHIASLPAAAPAIGAVVLAPLAGMLLLPVIGGELPAASALHGVMAVLAVVSVLAAAGCAALVLSVRPALPVLSLSGRALLVGALAGLLPAAPELMMGIGWHPVQIAVAADPEEPMREVWDAWVLRHGVTGLLVIAAAAVLAGLLGRKVLGAVFGVGLLTYGVLGPIISGERSLAPGVALGLFLAGGALGVALAMTRWRVWFAVGSATLLAVLTITAFLAGDVAAPEPLSQPMSAATLVLAGLAVVTAVAAAASALPEPTTLPVAFGLLAVAVQLGLYNMGAFTQHSAVARADLRSMLGLLSPIAAAALLVGGLLVLAVAAQRRSIDASADQAP